MGRGSAWDFLLVGLPTSCPLIVRSRKCQFPVLCVCMGNHLWRCLVVCRGKCSCTDTRTAPNRVASFTCHTPLQVFTSLWAFNYHAHIYVWIHSILAHPVVLSMHTLNAGATTAYTIAPSAMVHIQWNPLYKGHLSNEDIVYSPNHIELCTNPPLN